MNGVYFIISRAEGSLLRSSDIPRTLTGQALSGACAATMVAGSVLAAGWMSELETWMKKITSEVNKFSV